ncbi:hypothetical protein SO694_00083166 [Aureococcus anophagefferens]|uniref:Core domain-containing protein n=1 Tax=Aureococcus anophagefferens TaxID=44056 RepID=A0ABR1FJD7_AURAN
MLARALLRRPSAAALRRPGAARWSTQPAEAPAATGAAPAAPKKRARALPAALTVTPNAAARINGMLSGKDDAIGVLLGVKRRGCNGMSYTLNYATEAPDAKHERVECDGAVVWVEPPALFHIARGPRRAFPRERGRAPPRAGVSANHSQVGTVMDFEETALETGFTFTNPNEKGRCGCGESFNV